MKKYYPTISNYRAKIMAKSININDLPSELLIKILQKIDKHSLKSAVLVSSRWKHMIKCSCEYSITMDCLHRDFYGKDSVGVEFLKRNDLWFNKIKIVDLLGETRKTVASILKIHGFRIVQLTLFKCYFPEFPAFIQMLNLIPNLEELTLHRTKCWDTSIESSDNATLKTKKLKSLQLIRSDYCFFDCFRMLKLNTIKIECSNFEYQPVVELLTSQQHLTRLSLYCDHIFQFFHEPMPFQLTHLSLYNLVQYTQNTIYNAETFMRSQTNVETLAWEHTVPNPTSHISTELINKFHELKSLRLDVCRRDCDLSYLIGNPSIRNLILVNAVKLSELYPHEAPSVRPNPNITQVTLYNFWENSSMAKLASQFVKLKKLSVEMFDMDEFDNIKFANLICLTIKNFSVDDLMCWKKFIDDNSQITELTIESYQSKNLDVNVFLQTTTEILKLHTLRLGDINADMCFFDIIRKNCTELKILDLLRCCTIPTHSELNDIPGLQFHYDNFNFRLHDLESWYERLEK